MVPRYHLIEYSLLELLARTRVFIRVHLIDSEFEIEGGFCQVL